MTLEEELGALLRTVGLAQRQRHAMTRRLGWDGSPPGTLAEAGKTAGYTRERVRQLEERVTSRVAAEAPELPLTRAALAVVGQAAPASRTEVAELIAEQGLNDRPFDAAGVLAAAELAGIDVEVVARPRVVLRRSDVVLEPVVAQVARSLVARDGATRTPAVASLTGLSARRVRRLVELDDGVTWLECGDDWLTIEPLGGTVGSALRKLVGAFPGSEPERVRAALDVELPLEVVACLIRSVATDVADALSTTERLLVDAIRADGGTSPTNRVTRAGEHAGVRRPTAAVCLSRSPLFRRVERGRWALAVA